MRVINFLRARFRKWLNEEYWIEDYLKMGMKIGENSEIQPGLMVDYSHCWLIEIGNNVTIAPQVYLLAHDASTKKKLDYTKIGKVIIGDNSFIGARAVIMPNVTVGENSIVAAGSIVTKSVPANSVVGGNPAKYLMSTAELMQKHKTLFAEGKIYDASWTINGGITQAMKLQMAEELHNMPGYVK